MNRLPPNPGLPIWGYFTLGCLFCVVLTLLSTSALVAQDTSDQDQSPPTPPTQPQPVEAISLLGMPLHRAAMTDEQLAKLEGELRNAIETSNQDGTDAHKLIWVGRRLGYLQRYRESIQVFSVGIQTYPDIPHTYRHRGHRYISVRKFDHAIADFTRAANLIQDLDDEVEPDGMPNAAGIPTSTLHTNIWYHLGLAHYLRGEFQQAKVAYEKCLAASANNDMKVATLDWLYMTLRRLGEDEGAMNLLQHVTADMKILENHAYHRRLLMYKGELKPEDLIPQKSENDDLALATYGYGIGNWYLVNGDRQKARKTFEKVVKGKHWSAFGYIAAEAELARMKDE